MDQEVANERWVLLGASSGLGKAYSEVLTQHRPGDAQLKMSRTEGGVDFSKESLWPEHFAKIQSFRPTRIIYFAAGGPYGTFQKFQWKDHEWAFKVSFLFPAYLLHSCLQMNSISSLKQVTLIGSEVAEQKPDPGAASYCASKHALKGLVSTLQLERLKVADSDASNPESPRILLYSPGYMETRLLPPGSWPRTQGLAADPHLEALKLYDFVFAEQDL